MPLDEAIVAEAKSAREAVLELERQQEHATVDYHHQIRRLHAAGGSLREVAEALGLSHQRVHQIVGAEPPGPFAGPMFEEIRRHRGRRSKKGFVGRFTEGARAVVARAQDEARALEHDYIGTEHVLLGLLREEGTVAARALASLGITLDVVRAQVVTAVGQGPEGAGGASPGQIPFTTPAKRVLEQALREALRLDHHYIGSEHLLLALVGDRAALALEILVALGVEPDAVRSAVEKEL
jgi:hypothetical protein